MRWNLIAIAIAIPLVLANSVFWWLVQSQFSAATVAATDDGGGPMAQIGPAAPWPKWAVRPDGGRFTVKAWFGPTTQQPSTGHGEVALAGDPKAATDAYKAKLEAAGYNVKATLYTTMLPEIPPRTLVTCRIVASARDGGPRAIMASIDRSPVAGRGRVHWLESQPLATWPTVDGPPC